MPSFERTPILNASTAGGSDPGFPCGSGNGSPAVFYQFVGNGARVLISTCSETTDFNTQLVLESQGKTCGGSLPFCNSPATTLDLVCDPAGKVVYLEFFSIPNQLYIFAVQSRDAGSTGNFGLTFLEYLRPENDVCESAALLQPESTTFGTTVNATRGAFPCGAGNDSPSIFYQFLGTGAQVRLSTCSNVTNFNTDIVVESHGKSCGGGNPFCLSPATTLDIDCDPTGHSVFLDIETEMNQLYLVAVQSRDTDGTGDFGLSLQSPGSSSPPTTNAPTGFVGSPSPVTETPIAPTGFPIAAPSTAAPSISPPTATTGVPTKAPSTAAPSNSLSTIDTSGAAAALAKMSLPAMLAVVACYISCVAHV